MTDAAQQFRDALIRRGIVPPADLVTDGTIHRCDADGRNGKGDAAYLLHIDGVPSGGFQNWRDGLGWEIWRANIGRNLSPVEVVAQRERIEASKRLAEAEAEKRRASARDKAAGIWARSEPAPDDHPYLVAKGVKAHGLRQYNGALVVPVREGGELHSLQFIGADGGKRFLTGGKVNGCYHSIGKPGDTICVVEGYATGASVHEATGNAVAVAFDAGRLLPVAEAMRAKFPDARLILCADDDHKTESNPGLTKATEAALAVSGLLAVPDFGSDRPDDATDLNDLHRLHGREAAAAAVGNAKTPGVSAPQPDGKNATAAVLWGEVSLVRGDSITPEPVSWIWDGWLAAGKFHVLAGQPGTGKTTLALAFAATITVGGRWPDRTSAEAANVLIWSGEDDAGDTLVPRLRAMGADMSRVYFIGDVRDGVDKRSFDPARDVLALVHKAETVGDIGLLIVDPIVSAVSGDSHKNAETRRALQPLVDLATRLRCVVLGISHFTKGTSGREPIERVTGSLAFGALARVVLVAAKLQAESDSKAGGRMLARAKSNIGPDTGGFGYDLDHSELTGFAGVSASRVLWGAAIDGTARELLAQADANDGSEEHGALDDVTKWLMDLLTDGPRGAKEAQNEALAAGFSIATLRRAKAQLPIETYREGFGPTGAWVWRIKGAQTSTSKVLTEHLCQNPHGISLPAKVLNEHLCMGKGEHLSGKPSAGDDREEFTL